MSDLPRAVTSWRDQVERLSPHTSPCRYRPPIKWVAMRENALTFIDRFGAEAYRQGRAAPQLFGVHPVHGTVRGDCCGVPMAAAAPASGGEPTRVPFDRASAYRNPPGQQWGIPVWELAARDG
ncbi:hypothetical protein [Methylobacterium sp. CM6257]